MRRVLVLFTLLLALVAATSPTSVAATRTAMPFDEEEDCLEAVPASVSPVPPPFDAHRPIIDVLLLLDGVSHADGVDAMWDAAAAFRGAGIQMRTQLGRVRVPADGRYRDPDGRLAFTASEDRVMRTAKVAVGGRRPAGIDVVYLLTSKNLYEGRDQRDRSRRSYAIAGRADCIGGIRFPHRAFAIGELLPDGPTIVGIRMKQNAAGKVFAHEVAHLLGGHHHLANCAESVPAAALDRSTDTCTLMFNAVNTASLRLSAANRAVVRGHAITYG